MNQPPNRQQQILELLATGATHDAMANQLHVSKNTIKTHLKSLYDHLNARNAPHAVAIGYQRRLLDAGPAEPTG